MEPTQWLFFFYILGGEYYETAQYIWFDYRFHIDFNDWRFMATLDSNQVFEEKLVREKYNYFNEKRSS